MTAPALSSASADRVLLIHAQMNIVDKPALMRTVARLLRPGGALRAWETCAAAAADVSWPVPWSLDGTDSHLASETDLRAAIEGAGLRVTAWEDRTAWVQQWFQRALCRASAVGAVAFQCPRPRPRASPEFRAGADDQTTQPRGGHCQCVSHVFSSQARAVETRVPPCSTY